MFVSINIYHTVGMCGRHQARAGGAEELTTSGGRLML